MTSDFERRGHWVRGRVGGLVAVAMVLGCAPGDNGAEPEWIDGEDADEVTRPAAAGDVTDRNDGTARVAGFDATIALAGTDIELSWADQGAGSVYSVWRSTDPYFSPGDAGAIELATGLVDTSYTDAGGNDGVSYYYRAQATAGPSPGVSTTLGKFVQPLVSDGWTLLGFPLLESGNRDAQVLGDLIPGTIEVWRWHPHFRYYTSAHPNPPWNAPNFTWEEGEAAAVLTNSSAATTYTQVGYVPLDDDVDRVLDVWQNVVTVPLSMASTNAAVLSAQWPTVTQLDNWNMETQAFEQFYAPAWGTNFSIESGRGLWIYVDEPTQWPQVPPACTSLSFDGVNDVVVADHFGAEEWTVEAWIRPSLQGGQNAIVSQIADSAADWLDLEIGLGHGILEPYVVMGSAPGWPEIWPVVWWGESITADEWHHIAGIYDGTTLRLAVDGVMSPNTNTAPYAQSESSPLQIGSRIAQNLYYEGDILEVRLSSVARYDSDFTPQEGFLDDADTERLWRFDEGEGNLALDDSTGVQDPISGATWTNACPWVAPVGAPPGW